MAHTYGGVLASRTSSTSNPITRSIVVPATDTVIVLLLKVNGGTDRTGGSPSWNGVTMTQANQTQKAAASPEAGCELWYLLNPTPATANVSIPNAGGLTIFSTVVTGRSATGKSLFAGANGSNNTSANPSPGTVVQGLGDIAFAVSASGVTTWAPTAQAGTVIANTDDGAHGGGEQYTIAGAGAVLDLNWTQSSDDWGAVVANFTEQPKHRFQNYMRPRGGNATVSVGGVG